MFKFSVHRFILSVFFLFVALLAINHSAFSQETSEEKDPVAVFNTGQDAHEKGNLAKAVELYKEALKIAPEFPEAQYQLGTALQSLGRDSEAEKSYRQALTLRENWILPMVSLGELLVSTNQLTEAETTLTKALTIDKNNQAAYAALAELRLKTKSDSKVLEDLLAQIQALPTPSSSLLAAKGAIELELGDKSSAKSSLDRALTLEPNNVYALVQNAEFALADNKASEAQIYTEKLAKVSPNAVNTKILQAKVFAVTGKTAEALQILQTLDGKNPDVIALKRSLATNASDDVSLLEKQLAENPKNSALLGRLCVLTRTTPAKGLDYCRRALEIEPQNVSYATGYGAALVQAKQFANAVTLFRQILEIEPTNFTIHANLATALFELNRYAEAKTEYQWLLQNKNDLVIAYYFLAIVHDNLREYDEALTNYKKFLQFADVNKNQLEIDKVNLRLPVLERQIDQGKGTKKGRKP